MGISPGSIGHGRPLGRQRHGRGRGGRALGPQLPPGIATRKKQPYRSPDSKAFEAGGVAFVEDALAESSLRRAGYFDPQRVQLLWRKVRAGRAVSYKDSMAFTGVLSTQVWHGLFVEGVTPAPAGT